MEEDFRQIIFGQCNKKVKLRMFDKEGNGVNLCHDRYIRAKS